MGLLKFDALATTPLKTDPYNYVVVENFVDAAAKDSIARGSKSFAAASLLFDPETRERAWLLYAWCRRCDDIADGQDHGHGMTRVADAPARLEALVKKEPRICSTRFHVHRGNTHYFDSFSEPGVRALWKKAVDLNLVVELDLGPNYARDAGAAIAAFPGCKVLIDHMCNPKTGMIWEYGDVLDLAKYPNVYMKMSGLGYMTDDKPDYQSQIPFTRRVIKEFGADRMVWSGDSPHIADVHMKGHSAADIAKVKGGNLQRLLNWA